MQGADRKINRLDRMEGADRKSNRTDRMEQKRLNREQGEKERDNKETSKAEEK